MFSSARELSLIFVSHLIYSLSSFLLPYAAHPNSPSLQSPCLPCSVALLPGEEQVQEEAAVHNGCHDDRKSNGSKVCLLLLPEPSGLDFQLLIQGHECLTLVSLALLLLHIHS